jgi:hypothetical protein
VQFSGRHSELKGEVGFVGEPSIGIVELEVIFDVDDTTGTSCVARESGTNGDAGII